MTDLRPHPYTTRARVALAIARALAAGRGERDVTPTHVALGLVREGENGALAVLHHCGVPLGPLRSNLERALGAPPGGTRPDEVALPPTAGEARLVEAAGAAAQELGDPYVGPEHLLLAVLGDRDSPPARLLADYGVTAAEAEAAVRAVIATHEPRRPPGGSGPAP